MTVDTPLPCPPLLSCPFCGASETTMGRNNFGLGFHEERDGGWIICMSCYAEGPLVEPADRAAMMEAWNRRTPDPRVVVLEAALKNLTTAIQRDDQAWLCMQETPEFDEAIAALRPSHKEPGTIDDGSTQARAASEPQSSEALPVNHAEALELAHYKRANSNMARCYIELHSRAAEMENALRKIVNSYDPFDPSALYMYEAARAGLGQ